MQISKNKKRAGIVGGALGTAMVGMAAFAAFTGAGNFVAGGNVENAPVALDAAGGQIESLYPGRCSDVTVTFSNPNSHPAKPDLQAISGANTAINASGVTGLALNPAAFSPQVRQAAAAFEVPAGSKASFTIPNLLCLSPQAGNDVAGKPVSLTGHVPFVYVTETEYQG